MLEILNGTPHDLSTRMSAPYLVLKGFNPTLIDEDRVQ